MAVSPFDMLYMFIIPLLKYAYIKVIRKIDM